MEYFCCLSKNVQLDEIVPVYHVYLFSPTALRKAKIVYNFGPLSAIGLKHITGWDSSFLFALRKTY